MNVDVSTEFQSFTESIARFLEDHSDTKEATALWETLAEMGVCALAVPPSCGGIETNGSELLSLMRTLGSKGVATAIINQAFLPARLLALSASPLAQGHLSAIGEGQAKGALAHDEVSTRYAFGQTSTRAFSDGGRYRLSGLKPRVMGGQHADFFLVSATLDNGGQTCFFLIEREHPGLEIQNLDSHDQSGLIQLALRDAILPAEALVLKGEAAGAYSEVQDYARFLVSAESLGLMSSLANQTLEHLQSRVQFGQALAHFQVLQHRVVDMFTELRRTETLVTLAASRLDQGDKKAFRDASLYAKFHADDAGRYVGQQAIQLHGGMGLTQELKVGALYKRLLAIAHLHGDQDYIMDLLTSWE